MESGTLAVIGIALATMFFGYFFGLYEGRGQGYKKRKKEEAADPAVRAAVVPLPPPSPPMEPAPRMMPPAEKSLLRLTLDARGQPALDLDGEHIDTETMNPQERRRLIDLMVLMRPWLESGPVQKAPAQPTPPPPRPSVASSEHRPTVPPFEGQVIPTSVPARGTGPLSAPPPPSEPPPSAPTTMVGQIDAILQTKLTGTTYATKGIRLVESAQGGAMVVVGLSRYAGVGEVPDAEVQALIRAAIAEWEEKYTPS
jgi:hypothetical protein